VSENEEDLRPEPLAGVYFIRCGDFVKIGFSGDVARRMVDIQVANPIALELLCVLPVDRRGESQFHDRFQHLWVRGEWHHYGPELKYFIGTQWRDCLLRTAERERDKSERNAAGIETARRWLERRRAG
jgi:hypothetical protein